MLFYSLEIKCLKTINQVIWGRNLEDWGEKF